jgi:hypothetical protein
VVSCSHPQRPVSSASVSLSCPRHRIVAESCYVFQVDFLQRQSFCVVSSSHPRSAAWIPSPFLRGLHHNLKILYSGLPFNMAMRQLSCSCNSHIKISPRVNHANESLDLQEHVACTDFDSNSDFQLATLSQSKSSMPSIPPPTYTAA